MKAIDKLKIMCVTPPDTRIVAYKTFLKKMLKECEKYRWHDLRKDPKDLPNKDEMYLVCIEYSTGEKEIGMGYYKNMYWYRRGYANVIAWREISYLED